jgi:hypothetical protein
MKKACKYELLRGKAIKAGVRKLFRIRALRDFGDVRAGDIGGYIESELNLSHDGNAWVFGNARVSGDAWVSGNACGRRCDERAIESAGGSQR